MSDGDGQVNRFVLSLLAMLVIFAAVLVIVLTWTAGGATIDRVGDFAGFLEDHNNRDGKLILTLGMIIIILVMASVLVVELTAATAAPAQKMRVSNVTSGEVTISTARIGEHIDEAARGVPHVADCKTTVGRRGKRIDVVLDLYVDPGADLAQTADEACRRAHALVDRLGIELAAMPRARLHYRELRLQSGETSSGAQGSWERPTGEEQRDN